MRYFEVFVFLKAICQSHFENIILTLNRIGFTQLIFVFSRIAFSSLCYWMEPDSELILPRKVGIAHLRNNVSVNSKLSLCHIFFKQLYHGILKKDLKNLLFITLALLDWFILLRLNLRSLKWE